MSGNAIHGCLQTFSNGKVHVVNHSFCDPLVFPFSGWTWHTQCVRWLDLKGGGMLQGATLSL